MDESCRCQEAPREAARPGGGTTFKLKLRGPRLQLGPEESRETVRGLEGRHSHLRPSLEAVDLGFQEEVLLVQVSTRENRKSSQGSPGWWGLLELEQRHGNPGFQRRSGKGFPKNPSRRGTTGWARTLHLLLETLIVSHGLRGECSLASREFPRRTRALRPQLPALLATGRADQTALDLVAAYPGVTLLAKPYSLKELQEHLEILMKN